MKTSFRPIRFRPAAAIAVAWLILAAVILAAAGCTAPVTETSEVLGIRLITPSDAKTMLENDPDVLLLDVRTVEEYAAGHIAGSQLLPYDEIESRADELPADRQKPVIIYCRSGRRSAIAAETLASLGFTEIYDLGGIQDWPYETVVD